MEYPAARWASWYLTTYSIRLVSWASSQIRMERQQTCWAVLLKDYQCQFQISTYVPGSTFNIFEVRSWCQL